MRHTEMFVRTGLGLAHASSANLPSGGIGVCNVTADARVFTWPFQREIFESSSTPHRKIIGACGITLNTRAFCEKHNASVSVRVFQRFLLFFRKQPSSCTPFFLFLYQGHTFTLNRQNTRHRHQIVPLPNFNVFSEMFSTTQFVHANRF